MLGIDPRNARSAWAKAAVYGSAILLLFLLYLIRKTLLVFIIASMFAYLLYPLVEAVHRKMAWKSHVPAVVLPFALILGSLTLFGLFIKDPVRHEAMRLKEQVMSADFEERLSDWQPLDLPVGAKIVENYSQLFSFLPKAGIWARVAVRDIANFFIVPILSFFMLKDGPVIRSRLLQLLGISKEQSESVVNDAHLLMLEYMRSLLFLCLATLLSFSIVLSLMGVRYPLLLALLAFPLEFVPVVGPVTAGAVIIGVCAFNHYPHIPGLIAFLILYRLFQDYVLSLRIPGHVNIRSGVM